MPVGADSCMPCADFVIPPYRRGPNPLQVSPSEQYSSPPLPRKEWEQEHAAALHAAEATAAAAAYHAAGPLQVCRCAQLLPLLYFHTDNS